MTAIWDFPSTHPIAFAAICSFLTAAVQYVWSAFISALPSPTATSSAKYQFWFKFFNVLAANISRAQNSKVESSPNFVDAVNAQNAKTGTEKRVVEMTPDEAKS